MAQQQPPWANVANGNPNKKLIWLEDSLWSRVAEMVGLHGSDNNTVKGVENSAAVVDCSRGGAVIGGGAVAPNVQQPPVGATNGGVRSVVCSPDLAVYAAAQPQRVYQCELCRKTFSQKNTYQNHMRSHAIGSPNSSTSSTAVSTMSPTSSAPSPPGDVSTSTSPAGAAEDPYPCTICGKTFAVPARLTRHFRTHTGEKPYTCEYCHKSFSVKENLSVHRRIHTKERPYKCEVCERAFEHSGKLHRHMRIHTGERPHRCGVCGKTFIQSGQLVIHTRTHTGEKPYVCSVCGKGFTCSKQLKVHSRTHTGEKPYACEICGKAFGYNHVLKLHQVAHFGEKVYKCTLCHTTFTNKKLMEAHIKTHSSTPQQVQNLSASSSPPRELSDKENKDSPDVACSSPFYVLDASSSSVPSSSSSINPALLAVVAAASKDDEENSRSSSATPPLRVDEDEPLPMLEPAVRLCPDPLSALSRHHIDYPDRESSPDFLRGSPPAPSAQYVVVDPPPQRRKGSKTSSSSSGVDSPMPPSSPDYSDRNANNGASDGPSATKRSRMILQRWVQESTPAPSNLRSSSVIRFAQRTNEYK
ncbi:hypothetical protein B566_EDAN006631 [Ephemera danica]|nr:hypothetical protein B566_EDAN006631 [Ephemera danica]